MSLPREQLKRTLSGRKRFDRLSYLVFLSCTSVGIVVLCTLLIDVLINGIGWLNWDFLTNYPSRRPANAGIKSAFFGTIWMITLTAPIAFVLGVGTAIYLEEYAKKNWFTRFIQVNISNLAGVPSIVFGILGLTLFVRGMGLGRSILAGAFTMALLILPIIVVASQEALKSIPQELRHASYALGGTKWQTIRRIVLPAALPGILTGNILALSRAIGETAPLIMIGALTFVAFTPSSPLDQFTVMPIQIFNWISRPQEDFQYVAAAGIIVLLAMLLTMNALAIYLRNKFQHKF
ncbi:phosphate ABC transporter, inner membrane subunit PstA [Caldalkalibacillus thermarum TA2.A1]|uniref:Phosphate transport system permease protein PstA n=1 Tax=Caldalkalibacillus thermarum (strain TA2.A1) TaxID=986075 RepID=F5L7P6_CALTT|nr:phosphate ABC transporter permease PstA [Caldalkalibacillus thermarum]EGL82622.1 phosphate ABC transporter, inner membrane subunit PstA [Caldalkalibacillus thermarum TA2.A1]QZT33331.1 phosphate ABC transporter permease PstA [Caldalkalibacillus thermarum TA2.A1]